MNLAMWLERAGRSHPDLPAVAHGDQIVADYGRLAQGTAAIAGALRKTYGLTRGDRVAVVSKNHPGYLEALFGIWWGGFAAVPINAKLHPTEIGWILEHSGARAVFASADVEPEIAALDLPGVRDVVVFGSRQYHELSRREPAPLAPCNAEDLAWLFYTSGTTGRPKGAMLSHRNLTTMSLAYLAALDQAAPGSTLLHAAPMSHGSGLWALPHVCAMALNAVPESGGFDASEVLESLRSRPGTSMFAAPTMVRRMVDSPVEIDPAVIRMIAWGGAPMLVSDVVRALDRFGPCMAQLYGQGESPMTITFLTRNTVADRTHPRWLERIGSAGIANPAVEVCIGGQAEEMLAIGETGEVLVRGDSVMLGYWDDAGATAAALQGGWLHTGDVGSLDDHGYLTLKDRSKDVIISAGSNIYPREVEEVLISHSGVLEVSVIGRPDPEWGEIVVAYVVGNVAADELDRLCLARIARFKRPKEYVFLDALPRNNYGKILKTDLRALDRTRAARASRAIPGRA